MVEYDMRSMLNMRYQLMPYIYSDACQIFSKGSNIMRPLVMDFKGNPDAIRQAYEHMFGKSFLIAPVTEPNVTDWNVYLRKAKQWYDFYTGKKLNGGHALKTAAPQDKIPVFVKAVSIIPFGKSMQSTAAMPLDTLEIRHYTGADG